MYSTSQKWKDTIYKNVFSVLNIYFDNVLVNPSYIVDFKPGGQIFDKELELGSVSCQYIELKIHKRANITIPSTIRIEYGILINHALTVKEVNAMTVGDLSGIQVKSLCRNDGSFEMIPMRNI